MKISKKYFLDNFILLLMVLQCFILGYFGYTAFLNILISLLIIIRMIFNLSNKSLNDNIFIMLLIVIALFFLDSLVCGINLNIFRSNALTFLYPLLYLFFLYDFNKKRPGLLKVIIENNFLLINIWLWINYIIVYVQANSFVLIPKVEFNIIENSADLASGLFFYGGTHCLCLFIVLVILLSIKRVLNSNHKLKKNLYLTYTLILTSTGMYISTLNDNKIIFLMLIIYLILMFVVRDIAQKNVIQKNFIKNFKNFILIGVIGIVCLYFSVGSVNEIVNKLIFSLFNTLWGTLDKTIESNGSNERITMITYFLSSPKLWCTGIGLGLSNVYTSGLLNFRHFGIASLGTTLLLGGAFYTWAILNYYNKIVCSFVNQCTRKQYLAIFGVLLFMSIYTQIFFVPVLAFMYVLTTIVVFE